MNVINVKDLGAVGDGRTLDSPAIQKALDKIAADGGGTVIIPPGVFYIGCLQLRSNLILRLEPGAVLKASVNPEDYVEDKTVNSSSLRHYLLEGRNVTNVTIEGKGQINGCGQEFWEDTYINERVLKPKSWRPVMIYMVDSSNITLKDFSIINAAAYTVWTLGCESVLINNLFIRNPRNGPNTDALDIDCCRNVRISDCDIDAGDDCIAIKSDNARLGSMMPSENIVVSNCNLSSSTCGIRLGYEGDAPIRDCVFSNLTMYRCRHGINILSIVPDAKFTEIKHGTPVERIIFSNITMREVERAVFIWAGKECDTFEHTGYIRDISITGLTAQVTDSSYIGSMDDAAISEILLKNISLVQDNLKEDTLVDVPCQWGGGFMPWSLNLRNIQKITLDNVNIRSSQINSSWKGRIAWHNVKEFSLNGAQVMNISGSCD